MARSFLFPQDSGDAATTRLIAMASQMTGFMKGEPGPARPGWYQPGSDNNVFLANLHRAIAQSYPAASPAFYAVRLWTNLLWQPAYLVVIAAHLHGTMPDIGGLSQQQRTIYIDGYRLVPGTQKRASLPELIADGGRQLKMQAEVMLNEVNQQTKLKPLPAKRLLADRMLGLMAWLSQRRRDLSRETIIDYTGQWLDIMGLTGQGDLQPVDGPDGQRLVIVRRKGCCLDYLIAPNQYCTSCPKQNETERIVRQTANALAELGYSISHSA